MISSFLEHSVLVLLPVKLILLPYIYYHQYCHLRDHPGLACWTFLCPHSVSDLLENERRPTHNNTALTYYVPLKSVG